MNRFRLSLLAFVLLAPFSVHALGPGEPVPLVAQAQKMDRTTLHSSIEQSKFPVPFENLGMAACSFLTRDSVANWNVAGGECKFIKFLNQPKNGRFISTEEPGQFLFQPTRLGKDVIRFLVENTTNGRRAIVSLHIAVVKPEA